MRSNNISLNQKYGVELEHDTNFNIIRYNTFYHNLQDCISDEGTNNNLISNDCDIYIEPQNQLIWQIPLLLIIIGIPFSFYGIKKIRYLKNSREITNLRKTSASIKKNTTNKYSNLSTTDTKFKKNKKNTSNTILCSKCKSPLINGLCFKCGQN